MAMALTSGVPGNTFARRTSERAAIEYYNDCIASGTVRRVGVHGPDDR